MITSRHSDMWQKNRSPNSQFSLSLAYAHLGFKLCSRGVLGKQGN